MARRCKAVSRVPLDTEASSRNANVIETHPDQVLSHARGCADQRRSSAPTPSPPFKLTQVAQFDLPWRIAFLPDGRMLITEKIGKLFLATQSGQKLKVTGVPPVLHEQQNGLFGVYLAPSYSSDAAIYVTYSEPEQDPSTPSLALARATLKIGTDTASLENLKVVWHDPIKGKGGRSALLWHFRQTRNFSSLRPAIGSASPPPKTRISRPARSCD